MPEPPDRDELLLLDACVVINLSASRQMEAIVRSLAIDVGVVALVQAEAGNVRRGGDGDDADEREPIELAPLLERGLLRQVEPTEEELDRFAALTVRLDDGEAMTAAVALARGWAVATDERKAITLLANQIRVLSTLDLVKTWADRERVDPTTLARALADLRDRGRYHPGPWHPWRAWWDDRLGSN